MNETEIRQTVFRLLHAIAPEANLDRLDPDENLRRALDIDSFDALNFMSALHDELGVEIPESDYGELSTLSRVVRYLSARVGSAR